MRVKADKIDDEMHDLESELFTTVIRTRHLKHLMPLKATSQKVITLNGYEYVAWWDTILQ